MIWIAFSPQVGQEMRDEHPMLVLSSAAFNARTGWVIGLPMTHATSNESNPFALKYISGDGLAGYVLTHQPKSFDWRLRGARPHPWQQVPETLFQEACSGLNQIVQIG